MKTRKMTDRMLLEGLVNKYGAKRLTSEINKMNEDVFTDTIKNIKNTQPTFGIHYVIYLNSTDRKIHVHITNGPKYMEENDDYITNDINDAFRYIYQNDSNPSIEIVNSLKYLYI